MVRRRRDQRRRPASSGAAFAIRSSTLWPGSWPPSPGFAPCATLICELVGVDEVPRRDAEPARRDLLDRGAPQVAVLVGDRAVRLLAALAGVRPAADPVHRDRRASRAPRRGSTRSSSRRWRTAHDLGRRLDLVERDRRRAAGTISSSPRSVCSRVVVVERVGELLERRVRRRRAPRAAAPRSCRGSTRGARRARRCWYSPPGSSSERPRLARRERRARAARRSRRARSGSSRPPTRETVPVK